MEDLKIQAFKSEEVADKKAKECLVKLFDEMLIINNIKSLINDFHIIKK